MSAVGRAIRMEATKALTLRSAQATALAAVVVPPVVAVVQALAADPTAGAAGAVPVESLGFSTAGLAQPLVILAAVLLTGTEHVDGQLRSTLLAVPRRGVVLAAKALVIAALAAVVALVGTTAAVLLAHAVRGDGGLPVSGSTAGMAGNLVGVVVNFVLIGLLAASVTVLTRSLVVPLVVLVPLVLGLTVSLVGLVPAVRYLPDLAGIQLLTAYPGVGLLEPVPGALVMLAWTGALGTAATLSLLRRDA
jgi:ABC-2 type transport system permease protein